MDLDTLNPEAKELLLKLVKKTIGELNVSEIAFLQARRDYLSEREQDKFASILSDKNIEKFQKQALEKEQARDGRVNADAEVEEEKPVIEEDAKPKAKKDK